MLIEYVVQFRASQPGNPGVHGSFEVKLDPSEKLQRHHIENAFPYEGSFHFRSRVYSRHEQKHLWLDLTNDKAVITPNSKNKAVIQALPLFELDDPFSRQEPSQCPYTASDIQKFQQQLSRTQPASENTTAMAASAFGPDDMVSAEQRSSHERRGHYMMDAENAFHSVQQNAQKAWQTISKRVDTQKIKSASSTAAKAVGGFFKRTSAYVRGAVENVIREQPEDSTSGKSATKPNEIALVNLRDLQADCIQAFRAQFPPHENLLEELWQALLPDEPFIRVSPAWQLLGFQQENPTSDFRGAGLLGLKCMVHLAKSHTLQVRSLLFSSDEAEQLPFALASINLTVGLATLLGISSRTSNGHFNPSPASFWPLFENNTAFFELHSLGLFFLYDTWRTTNARVGSDAFSRILADTLHQMASWLAEAPLTVSDLTNLVRERHGIELLQ